MYLFDASTRQIIALFAKSKSGDFLLVICLEFNLVAADVSGIHFSRPFCTVRSGHLHGS
jgi:hypothetical protein